MAFTMTLWERQAESLVELAKQKLDQEVRLETWIEKDSGLIGLDLLFVGRQVRTPFGGRIDLLALDQEGDVVIIELKRDKTPREVVAQGAFANQNIVCKLRDQRTLDFLRQEFGVQ